MEFLWSHDITHKYETSSWYFDHITYSKKINFYDWVLGIGDGTIGEENNDNIMKELPDDLLLRSSGYSLTSMLMPFTHRFWLTWMIHHIFKTKLYWPLVMILFMLSITRSPSCYRPHKLYWKWSLYIWIVVDTFWSHNFIQISAKAISFSRFLCNDYQQKSRTIFKLCRIIYSNEYFLTWTTICCKFKNDNKKEFEDPNDWWWRLWFKHYTKYCL